MAPEPVQREFTPAWQVDHFTWPRLCRRLIARAAEELDRLADARGSPAILGVTVDRVWAACSRLRAEVEAAGPPNQAPLG